MPHPDKRAALGILTVKRLGGLCDTFELERTASARKDDAALEGASLYADTHRQIKRQCRVAPTFTWPLPRGEKQREPIRRLTGVINEEARATVQTEPRLNR